MLEDITNVLSQGGLTEWQKTALPPILGGCNAVLSELNKIVLDDSCLATHSSSHSLRDKFIKGRKRITWDPDAIKDLRSRVALHVGFLTAFNGSFNRYIDPIKHIQAA